MAIPISGTLEPAGKFPLVEAASIGLPNGERLNSLFDDDGKIASDSLPDDVGGSDPRVDELLENVNAMFSEDGRLKEEYLPDIEASDPRVDGLIADLNGLFDDDGNLREEYLPEIEAADPRVDDLIAMAGNMFDENGKISEELLPEEKKPETIDLTQYASNGIIVENHADGSTVTHTVEFNADGKPVKVTTNGVTTTLTW